MVSQAIGLGNIMLHSHLNEPLDADIAIVDTKGIEPGDVIVTVADQKAYEEAGLQPIGWLSSIRFQIVKGEVGGRPVLKLKTKEVVKDPFVDLLIDVKWPGGQLLREYTLLLDPPKSVIPASRPIQKKQKKSLSVGAQSAKISNGEYCEPTILQGASRQVEATPGGIYGPICEESLWSIAKSLAHNTHSNVHQAVMAIAEKNPHAFRDGNIHYMLSGAVLKLPDKAELERYSIDQSQYYIAMQGQTPYHEPRFTHTKPTTQIQNSVTIAQKSPSKPQRALKLVAPVQSLETAVKVNTDAPKSQNQVVLAERLTLIEEAIDTLKRTNEDMTRKNQSLQDQNHSLEKLLSMKEDEIKKLVDMVKQPQPDGIQAVTSTVPPIPTPEPTTVANTPVQQFAVAISDVPAKPTHSDLTQPNISQMLTAKPIENVPNVATSSQPVVPNLAETEMKPNTIKVDNIAPHSQPKNKAISADETEIKTPEKSGSFLFPFLLLGFGVIILGIAWLRRHVIGDLLETFRERFKIFHVKQEFATANVIEPLEMANYGLQFDLERALDAIAAQEKKFKKTSQSAVKMIKDVDDSNKFDAKFADVEECISYERFGQAEKILKEILQQKADEWLAVYKLLDLYVFTEKYADFINVYEGLPADFKEISPRIWSKIESLRQKVTNESVRFQSPKVDTPPTVEPKSQEIKDYIDLNKDYPLALEKAEADDNINIDALPAAEVEELPKDPSSNTHDIQKAQIALAKAYIDMGEYNDAKEILNELKKEAFGEQLKLIEDLLQSIS